MKRRKRFFPKIWLKQLFFFLLLAAAVLLPLQVLFNLSLERQFQNYIIEREVALNRRIIGSILDYYSYNGSWAGIQMTLRHLSMGTDTYLLLSSPEGQPLVDSAAMRGHRGAMIGRPDLPPDGPQGGGYRVLLDLDETAIGQLYIEHLDQAKSGVWQEQDLVFRRALSSSLLWAGLLAAGAALILSIAFSRRLSQPLEEMSRAVKKVARSDYSPKLPAYDSRELNDLSANFNRMAEHLDELETLRRRSTADLSHELRTPLSTLRSHIEAIKDGVMEPDFETLNVISEEILHLGRVVNDLDELAQAEGRHNEQTHFEPVDLNRFLTDKAASFRPLCAQKRQHLGLDLPEQSVSVEQDPAALGKILGNLLANAYRYTAFGGVINVVLRQNAELDPDASPPIGADYGVESLQAKLHQFVQISVSDNGPGIDPGQLPYIFERFFRVDPSRERTPEHSGTGIGLALVKELARATGGAVLVSSSPGRGTTFHLYLRKYGGGSKTGEKNFI